MQISTASVSPRRNELVALLRAEQHRLWRRGELILVESYLDRHPALHDDPEAILHLVSNELLLREVHAEPGRLEDFIRRFPRHETQIRRVFDLHQSLDVALPESGGLIDSSACSFLQPLATELGWGRTPARVERPITSAHVPSRAAATRERPPRPRKLGNPLAGYPASTTPAPGSPGGLRPMRRKRKAAQRSTITLLLSIHATLITMAVAAMEWLELRSDQPLTYRVLTALGGSMLLLPLWYALWRHRKSTRRCRKRRQTASR